MYIYIYIEREREREREIMVSIYEATYACMHICMMTWLQC